ncbi:MOSC domain-containing protein [Achromobacter sp. 413638]|uniref:MOSC domain-containing protein n=1 Tax=Achromobacter sp. 413638 TaxID=3342385 RepID=UPI00370B7696
MSARILSLHIYPIKSCAGIDLSESPIDRAGLAHDRRWMLIDGSGQFMTQRQWPRMALIRTAIDDGALRVSAPDMADLLIALDGSGLEAGSETVTVWKDSLPALRESAAAGRWFSDFLGTPCRLYKVDPAARRPAKTDWVSRWLDAHPDESERFSGTHHFGFADGFPLLVANQASLDDLNARLLAKGAAEVPMDRFRPNIVVQGDWEAFEEDHTALIEAADVRMAFVKPCTRCSIPDIDQRSAQQFDEPGRTLASYRNLEIGVVFGQNAILDAPAQARLKVGDAVRIELDF